MQKLKTMNERKKKWNQIHLKLNSIEFHIHKKIQKIIVLKAGN